MVTATCDGGHP